MNNNIKKPLVHFISSLLTLKGWKDISEPILFQGEFSGNSKNLIDYFDDSSTLNKSMENKNYTLRGAFFHIFKSLFWTGLTWMF